MNTTTTTINSALLAAPYQLNIWFGSFLWIIGNVGCIGNMIVFYSRSFRARAYCIYLFFQAITDFFYLNSALLTRILQKGFQISITNESDVLCKIRQFIADWGNQISFTLFSLATIDRLLSTQRSNKYRQWSNRISLAYKLTIASLIFWSLIIGHRFIFYSVTNGACAPLAGFYADFDNYLGLVYCGMCPPLVTFLLAYLLIKSVHNVAHRRIIPVNHLTQTTCVHRTILQQMDVQLTLMLILQSIITIITYVPYSAELIYSNVTAYWPKSSLRQAQEKVCVELIHIISYVFCVCSFYVSVISSSGFRRQIKRLVQT